MDETVQKIIAAHNEKSKAVDPFALSEEEYVDYHENFDDEYQNELIIDFTEVTNQMIYV